MIIRIGWGLFFGILMLAGSLSASQLPMSIFIKHGSGQFEPTPANPGGWFNGVPYGTYWGEGYVSVIPGKEYNIVVQPDYTAEIKVPEGYTCWMNGFARNSFYNELPQSGEYPDENPQGEPQNVKIRITGPGGFSGRAGTATSLRPGEIFLQIAMGYSDRGEPMPPLTISGDPYASNWSDIFNPQKSVFNAAIPWYSEVRDWGHWRVNVWGGGGSYGSKFGNSEVYYETASLSSTAYEIKFYERAQRQGATVVGLPFIVYRIEKGATNTSLKITKQTRQKSSTLDGSSPIILEEQTSIERSGSWPNCTWTVKDWNEVGATQLVEKQLVIAGNTSAFTETGYTRSPGGPSEFTTQTTFGQFWWGYSPTAITTGTSQTQTVQIAYYESSVHPGLVKSKTYSGGGWEAFTYAHNASGVPPEPYLAFPKPRKHLKPFNGTPAVAPTTPASETQGEITTYGNFEPVDVTSETKINGITVSKQVQTLVWSANPYEWTPYFKYLKSQNNGSTVEDVVMRDQLYDRRIEAFSSGDGTARWTSELLGWWSGPGSDFQPVNGGEYPAGGSHSMSIRIEGSSSSTDGVLISNALSPSSITSSSFAIGNVYGWIGGPQWSAAASQAKVYLVTNKSTREAVYRDSTSRVVCKENSVWDGSQWRLVEYESYFYDTSCNLVRKEKSNGDVWEAAYIGDRKQWEKGADGILMSYTYDSAGRVQTATKAAAGIISALTTTYGYDSTGKIVSERIGPASGEAIVINRQYDDAGRLTQEGNAALLPIIYAYSPATRAKTTTLPNGGTQIETTNLGGTVASVTGTAVIPEYYSYGVESDGRRWTRKDIGAATSPRWSKSWTDWLGRVVRTERPGPPGHANFVEENFYQPATGKLVKTTVSSGQAPTLYTYGAMGRLKASGLDVNNSGSLEPGSMDRITNSEQYFFYSSNGWWSADRKTIYPKDNDGSAVEVSKVHTRLSGFTGNKRSETHTYDIEGRCTITELEVYRSTATRILSTAAPGAGVSLATSVNGLVTETENAEEHLFQTRYDSLGRPFQSVDPRTGTTTTTYYSGTVLPLEVTDPSATRLTLFTYNTAAQLVAKTDAFGKSARFGYNSRNQVTAHWGEAAIPVSFEYNSYGEQWKLHTYQSEANWASVTWPGGVPTATTTFTYDPATGLLLSKTDAANKSVLHIYNAAGKTSRRSWARTLSSDPGQRVHADYTYDPATGELLSTSYNDGTPSVTYTFDRTGRAKTVADATGTTTLISDPAKPWRTQSQTLGSLYGGRVLTSYFYETGWVGLSRGFAVSHPQAGQELDQVWGFTPTGRFQTVTSTGAGITGRTFRYTYETNSALVKAISIDGAHPFTQTNTYQTGRDLLTNIEAKWETAGVTRFDYTYNARREPESRKQSGYAYADYGDATFDRYGYNDRGELTSAIGHLGSNVLNLSQSLPGRREEFTYDASGNRKTAGRTGVAGTEDEFVVNALNQYTSRENNSLPLWGTANASADVSVGGSPHLAGRRGAFWSDELLVANGSGPFTGQINISFTLAGVVSSQSRTGLLAPALENFGHDSDGNLSSDGFWDFQWDAENRLVRMATTTPARIAGIPNRILEFKYDHAGRRVQKRVYNGDTLQTLEYRRYLYEGWNLVAEYTVDPSTSTVALARSYTWGLDLSRTRQGAGGVGGLLQIHDHVLVKALLPTFDGNGNVAALLNAATGTLEAVYEYSPYGGSRRVEGAYASANPFRFSTKFTDEESGLAYYGHRYYSSRNGRFINRDPIEEAGGLNLYGFCGNASVARWDYLGMETVTTPANQDAESQKAREAEQKRLQAEAEAALLKAHGQPERTYDFDNGSGGTTRVVMLGNTGTGTAVTVRDSLKITQYIVNDRVIFTKQESVSSDGPSFGSGFGAGGGNTFETTQQSGNAPNSGTQNNDARTLDAVQRGIIDAKTTIYGPVTKAEAARINKYLGTQTQIANANAGAAAGVATARAHPGVGLFVGYVVALSGPYPSRAEIRPGDILAITSGNVYLRKESGIPVGSFLDVRAMNNNDRPFVNDTGMDRFPAGTPATLLYETSSQIPAGTDPGVRIYKDEKGVIHFSPIP